MSYGAIEEQNHDWLHTESLLVKRGDIQIPGFRLVQSAPAVIQFDICTVYRLNSSPTPVSWEKQFDLQPYPNRLTTFSTEIINICNENGTKLVFLSTIIDILQVL